MRRNLVDFADPDGKTGYTEGHVYVSRVIWAEWVAGEFMSWLTQNCGRIWICRALAVAIATVSARVSLAADPDLVAGTAMYTAGLPTGDSPDGNMNQYALKINYFLNGKDATGGLGTASVPVPNITAAAGLPTPTAAQVSAASAAKAKAIVAAVNAAMLPGVTVAVDAKTQPGGMYPTGMTKKQIVFVPGRGNVQMDVPVLCPPISLRSPLAV